MADQGLARPPQITDSDMAQDGPLEETERSLVLAMSGDQRRTKVQQPAHRQRRLFRTSEGEGPSQHDLGLIRTAGAAAGGSVDRQHLRHTVVLHPAHQSVGAPLEMLWILLFHDFREGVELGAGGPGVTDGTPFELQGEDPRRPLAALLEHHRLTLECLDQIDVAEYRREEVRRIDGEGVEGFEQHLEVDPAMAGTPLIPEVALGELELDLDPPDGTETGDPETALELGLDPL